jgi:hypothetical protein
MILTAETPVTNTYRVEVSGWDNNRAFFVENSDLEWSEGAGKRLTLSHALADGAVIFLRLLQPMGAQRCHAVAYQAELLARTEGGQVQVRLRPVRSPAGRPMELSRPA